MTARSMGRKASFARYAAMLACAVTVLIVSGAAHGSSCGPRLATYYVACRSGQCAAEFRTVHARAFGYCGKRLVVEDVDVDAGPFVTSLVVAANPGNSGLWQVRLPLLTLDPADAGIRSIKDELGQYVTSEPPASISTDDWLALLDHWQRARWLIRMDTDASPILAADARREAERIARREWWAKFADASLYRGSALAGLAVLVQATHRFFFQLHAGSTDGRRRRLLACVLVQVAVLVGCVAIGYLYRFDVGLGLLLVPCIVILWLVQGWAYLRVRWLSSAA